MSYTSNNQQEGNIKHFPKIYTMICTKMVVEFSFIAEFINGES